MLARIMENYKQYGARTATLRAFKRIFARIIYVEKYYLLACTIKPDRPFPKPSIDVEVSFLSDHDIDSMDLPQSKKELYFSRLQDPAFKCLTARKDGKVVYYTWISCNAVEVPPVSNYRRLSNNEGFLLDSFCDPSCRGNRLHGFMMWHRLNTLLDINRTKALVVVKQDNHVARKVLESFDFSLAAKITTIEFLGKTFMKEKTL